MSERSDPRPLLSGRGWRGATIAPFSFDRTFHFDVPRAELWSVFEQVDRFTEWWAWLRRFEVDGGSGLREGVEARCVIRGPAPYELRLTIGVDEVVPERLVTARVDGDLRGTALLELADAGDPGDPGDPGDAASSARLTWKLEVVDPGLRAMVRAARPVLSWGHDVVISRGARQFRDRALGRP